MTQTTNYQLPQWSASDRVKRGDFNSAMSKIDTQMKANADAAAAAAAGVKGECKVVTGIYVGKAQKGSANPNTLTFVGKPHRVFICEETPASSKSEATLRRPYTTGENVYNGVTHTLTVTWTDNGVSWYGDDVGYQMNTGYKDYRYFALIEV